MGRSVHYLLPRDPSEVDRLDVQHYALRGAVGADFLAPVRDPRRVLDVGAGTGQWGFDLLERFPDAEVVGLDLSPPKSGAPPGYRFVEANLIHSLPFRDGEFDFVHLRLLSAGVPLAAWPDVVADLARVTRAGGWVELVEFQWDVDCADDAAPASKRLLELTRQMAARAGLDGDGQVFRSLDHHLRDAGLQEVSRREVAVMVGPWGGTVGALMATDIRSGATRLCEAMEGRGLISADAAEDLIQASCREVDEGRMTGCFAFAFGQKSG